MSSAVDIGTLQGTLAMRNAYSAEFDKFDKEVKEKLIGSTKNFSQLTQKESDKIKSSYDRVAASLDPVTANTQKYQRAELALTAALKAGIITQDQYNRSLSQAKDKYLSSSASTSTWREEMQKLTNVIAPFATRLADVSVIVKEVQGAFLGSSKAAQSVAGSASTASASLSTLYAVALPLAAVLGTIAVAAGGVYLGFKSFSFLKEVVIDGTKTQLVIERLNNTLLSTGSYSQMSSAQLVALAESYELLSGKSKEEIIAAETILARFQTLNQNTYPEALKVTLAYSRAMGVTADQAASKLGPALEGNTRALGALKEAGIVLSPSQKKTLQNLIDSGKAAEYQAKLLDILREKVGELSNEYDTNLSRQADRAKIVLEDFGESIANEVIPAIEDLVSEIVISLGGWDNLKKKVNEVGGAIGNFIRTSIYGLAIAFNEIVIVIKSSVIPAFQKYMEIVTAVGKTTSVLTLNKGAFDFYSRLGKTVSGLSTDISGNQAAIERLTKGLLEHRKGLEGVNEVYGSNGSVIDGIIGKNKELEDRLKELTQIYKDHSLELERIYALQMLATKGPFTKEDRLDEERKINEAHKDRIIFLQQEEKFGVKIAESLAKMRKELKDLELKARFELTLATKLEPIKLDTKLVIPKELQISTSDYQEQLRKSQDEFDRWVDSVASGWKERFKTMRDLAEEEIDAIKKAVIEEVMSVRDGERAIAQIRAEYYSSQVDKWSGFVGQIADGLSVLGGAFGKFMSQLAQMASSVQGVNQTANSLGGWSTAMGAFGGTVAAFVELYKFADSIIQKHKGEKYGAGIGSVAIVNSQVGLSYMGDTRKDVGQASLGVVHGIQDAIKAFEDALRISITDLAKIEIKLRNDGKSVQAWVKDKWIGTFSDVGTAIREALIIAIQDPSSNLRGMSALMQEGLKSWTSPDTEGLIDFLSQLRSISDLSLSPSIVSLQQTAIEFNRLRETLNKLDQSSQVVIDAQNELTDAFLDSVEKTKNALLGIDSTAADRLKDLIGFQKGIDSVGESFKTGLETSIKSAQDQLDKLNKVAQRSGKLGDPDSGLGGARPSEGGDLSTYLASETAAIDEEKMRLQAAISDWTDQLSKVPKALTKEELNLGVFTALEPWIRQLKDQPKYAEMIAKYEKMRLDAVFGQLKLQIIALGLWEEWAQTWQDLYNEAVKAANTPIPKNLSRSGGPNEKDQIRDFIRDKKFELSLSGLSDYQKAIKELNKQYDEWLDKSGKDKKLRDQLLALKKEELALLEKEAKQDLVNKFKEFLRLVTPFDKVRKTAADLIKDIQGSPFGDARKATMIGRIMADLNTQLDKMSKEGAVSLFGEMLSDMQKFGAKDEEMQSARITLAIFEHELKMAHYAEEIALLELEGRLAPDVIANFKKMFEFLDKIDPSKFIDGSKAGIANDNGGPMFSYYSSSETSDDPWKVYLDKVKAIEDKLQEWGRIPLSENLSRAHELTDEFADLMVDVEYLKNLGNDYTAQAQNVFRGLVRNFIDDTLGEFEESGSELENSLRGVGDRFRDINSALLHLGATQEDLARSEVARLSEVQKALAQYLDPIRERREARSIGERSILTGEQQYFESRSQFRDLFSQIRSGNLANLGNVTRLADQYEDLLRSYTGGEGLRFGLKEIDDTLLAIENLVPEFAQEMASVGSEENPMIVESTSLVGAMEANMQAVNNGNNLVLAEMRTQTPILAQVKNELGTINDILTNPVDVRLIA